MFKKPILQLHAAVFLWGFTGILGKLITLSEGWLVWYRMILTTLILLAILQFKNSLRLPPRKTLLQLVGTGAIIALHWVCFFGSIKYANVSVALVCLSSAGLFTALLEPVMRKTNFRPV
ncbi:MAG: EamA family transporter, partial [Sediminibacterium sp.]|nr:EamA family transporter [Sediminibacterium sp.]